MLRFLDEESKRLQQRSAASWMSSQQIGFILPHTPLESQMCNANRGEIPFGNLSRSAQQRECKHSREIEIKRAQIVEHFQKECGSPSDQRILLAKFRQQRGVSLPNADFYLAPCSFLSQEIHTLQPITGIFTKKKIRSGELFGLYLGARCSIPRWQQFLCDMKLDTVRKDVYGRTSYIFDIQDREGRITIIDAYYLKDSTFGRFINTPMVGERHIFENVLFHQIELAGQHHIGIFASRDIEPDHELCAFYGDSYYFTRYDMENLLRKKIPDGWTEEDFKESTHWYETDIRQNPWPWTSRSTETRKKMKANTRAFFRELHHQNLQVGEISSTSEETGDALLKYYRQKWIKDKQVQQAYRDRQIRNKKAKRRTGFEDRPQRRRKKKKKTTTLPIQCDPVLNKDGIQSAEAPSIDGDLPIDLPSDHLFPPVGRASWE